MPAPPSLSELQHAFAGVLQGNEAPALHTWIAERGIDPAARLRIYRHAGYAIHVDALVTAFPALRRLLGEECFDGLATRHAARRGSYSGNLQDYGADFAGFLAVQAETAAWPWLGDVARLEWLRQQAVLAADAAPADAAALLVALAGAQGALRLRPCVRVLRSGWAVLDLWRHALLPDIAAPDPATPQAVLLWREHAQVAMRPIAPAQAAFAQALCRQAVLAEALAEAQSVDATTPAEALLQPLLEHALFAA